MPIRSLVWACIECETKAAIGLDDRCSHCGATYRRGDGAKILVQRQGSAERALHPREIVRLLPEPGTTGTAEVEVQEWSHDKRVYALGRYLGRIDHYGPWRKVTLTLNQRTLSFSDGLSLDLLDITAIQPGSHAIQVKTNAKLVSIRLLDSSAFLWEERLHAALRARYAEVGRDPIADFLPRVCGHRDANHGVRGSRIRRRIEKGRELRPHAPWQYRMCSWIARTIWHRLGGGVVVEGLDNIPKRGPFLVVVNHESYLEPMLVPAVLSRPVFAMAKTTQFTVPFFGWLMAHVFAYPVRRFENDPHAIRFTVDRLSEGYGVMIYPEGERSWDGEQQPMRFAVTRLARMAGVPVIPCRVDGAYEAWPRWSSKPQRHVVRITFRPAVRRIEGADQIAKALSEQG